MTSPVDTSVKFFSDAFPGAPVLNGVAGAGIGVLDACLNTGFGLRSAVSLVVADGVATMTLSSDAKNANLLHSVVLVDGVTDMTDLNGEQRVTAASSTALAFATALADGTASGTITVKTAPAAWEKRFTGTNKAVFRSVAAEALGMHLWVDDTNAQYMRVRGYEAMSDVDTGTGPFPTLADSASGAAWKKSSVSNSTANKWDLYTDERAFYFCPLSNTGANAAYVGQAAYPFGDLIPYKSGDAFCSWFSGATSDPGTVASYANVFVGNAGGTSASTVFPRSYVGVGSAVRAYPVPLVGSNSNTSGLDNTFGSFPNPVDGALRLSKIVVNEGSNSGASVKVRAEVPGVFYCAQDGLGNYFSRGDTVVAGGRRYRALSIANSFSSAQSSCGVGFVDITGPWR